ncbi:hypothetical protein E1B28_005230 [Marasmius oreades]|uniref:Uncharacterized protein n=1 Tax=Marasmius oreades TaxID=181124 RepID=A0A9P8ADS5_9AGAR|nr:uncharacterized protein E1B28_005230 [Marasmius oreades]KAG7097919.1 hypothetical protein E1B28_005230 [Marasmius oreades]
MSFFQEACQVSIGQGTFSAVTGNQINNIYNQTVERQERKRTIYDEFLEIRRGSIVRLQDLARKDSFTCWNSTSQECEIEFRVERTISTAKIHGDSSCFTVMSYKGQDAQKAWKKDFREFSETTNTTAMQLFGINRSSVPLLIFHGALVPLAHFWDRLGDFGRGYAYTFAWISYCFPSEVWIDPEHGTLVHGVEGPISNLFHFYFPAVETMPSNVELLLQEDICFRYFSRFPLVKEFDRRAMDILDLSCEVGQEISPIMNRPYVLSSKTNSIVTVGLGGSWHGEGCLNDRVVMPDGRTRFTLTDTDSTFVLLFDTFADQNTWHSQALSVFHRLGISLDDDDLSTYKLISPCIRLRGLTEDLQRHSEGPPIYMFLHPLAGGDSLIPTHTWSYDENGEISIPHHHGEYLGLPTKLSVEHSKGYKYCWPSETYKANRKWQTARGFDPITTDFACHLKYPIWEVRLSESGRFEELADPSKALTFAESPRKDIEGQSVIGSFWSGLTAPFTFAADEDSKISVVLM